MASHNLEDPLLGRRSELTRVFSIKREELCSLFEPDHIREGTSIKKIQNMGGVDGLLDRLRVNLKDGLNTHDDADLAARDREFGKNDPIVKPPESIWNMIVEQFEDKVLQILTAAAAVSLIIGVIEDGLATGWMEGFAIFVAVIIIVSVTAVNNYLRDKQFRNLNSKREQRVVPVLRNGKIIDINVFSLLVGDIMHVNTGENFPIDGLLLKGYNLVVDESSITGESDPIRKFPIDAHGEEKINPFLVSGSKVMEGTGIMVVCAVGIHTQLGLSKLKLQEEPEITPLQLKLENVVDQISGVGKWCAYLTFAGMTVHLILEKLIAGEPIFDMNILSHLLEFFIIGVTIIVVAIPEGLPLAVTIALAYSVGKMKEENNLVRFLSACETMGGANNICTDKTGTLTQNRMSVDSLYIEENTHNPVDPKNVSKEAAKLFSEAVCINSDARPKKTVGGSWEQIGNKTECALLEIAYKMGVDYENYREKDNVKRIIPFSSKRKRMSTVWQVDDETVRVYVKGAPEILLEMTTKIVGPNGQPKVITEENVRNIGKTVISTFARKALRTIAIAYKDVKLKSRDIETIPEEELEDKLTFIAIAGIADPLRPEIPDAVRTCKKAGITVRMVTGDITETAVSIAQKAEILSSGFEISPGSNVVMEGKVFRQKVGGLVQSEDESGNKVMKVGDLEAFRAIERQLRVLARSSPEDKYILVTGLKQLNNVVAVTGDGTNDAPALKKADIGFAMGIMGTEVAKEASGIIILDDNFRSIVTAVKWGRNIFDCVRKFLQFQLTVNVVAMFMVFLGGVVLRESPFTPIQMLWVNLIMDTFASLALATEPPTEDLLDRKPYARDESMVTPVMWRNILGQAVYQIIVLLILLFTGETLFDIPSGRQNEEWTYENGVHYTIVFNAFVFMQICNFINARKLKATEFNVFHNFFNNPMFLTIEIMTFVIQIAFVELGGRAIKTTPLTWGQYFVCFLIGAGGLIVGVIIKSIPTSVFNNIHLLREEEVPREQLDLMQQSSLRKKSSLRYKAQSSLR